MLKRLAILVVLGLLTTSCDGTVGGNDGGGGGTSGGGAGGTTSGTGGTTNGNITVGQVCDSTGMAFCNRVAACQLATFSECFNAFKPSCCAAATTCAQVSTGMTAARLTAYETACDAAFQSETCADVGAGTVPAACSMAP